MNLSAAKAKRDAAKKKFADAKAALAANTDDTAKANLTAAVSAAQSELDTASDEYTTALETHDPLTVDIEKQMEAARKQEKDKLYATLEQSKKVADAEKKEKEALQAKLTELEKNKNGSGNGGADAATAEAEKKKADEDRLAKIEMEMEARRLEAADETKKLRAELEVERLQTYKATAISKANGKLVAAMVGGNTKEDIDASVVRAQQEYQRIAKETADSRASEEARIRGQIPTVPGGATSTVAQLTKDVSPDDIRKMTPQQWAEYRKNKFDKHDSSRNVR